MIIIVRKTRHPARFITATIWLNPFRWIIAIEEMWRIYDVRQLRRMGMMWLYVWSCGFCGDNDTGVWGFRGFYVAEFWEFDGNDDDKLKYAR